MTARRLLAVSLLGFACFGGAAQEPPRPDSVGKQVMALLEQDRPQEAERMLEQSSLRSSRDNFKLGDLTLDTYAFYSNLLVASYLRVSDYAAADRVARDRLALAERQHGGKALTVSGFLDIVADIARLRGKHSEAEPLYLRSLAILRSFKLDGCGMNAAQHSALAETYLALKRPKEAEELLRAAIDACRREQGGASTGRATLWNAYAVALETQDRTEEAVAAGHEADRADSIDPRFHAQDRDFMRGRLLVAEGRFDEAIALCRKWIAVFEVPDGPESDRRLMAPLAECKRLLRLAGRSAEAEKVGTRLKEIRTRFGVRF